MADKLPERGAADRGYAAWKDAKIRRALEQAADRAQMMPEDEVGANSALRVSFTPEARADLKAIREWIAKDNPVTAREVLSRIRQISLLFGSFPLLGRGGRIAGTREFPVTGLP